MPYADPEKRREYHRQRYRDGTTWRQRNPDKVPAISRAHRQRNLSHYATTMKQYWIDNPERYLFTVAKSRSKKDGIEFNIELADIVIPDVCPALGIPLKRGSREDKDASPSLDRINPRLGYVKGNVSVISHRANRIKSDATLEEMLKVLDYVKAKLNTDSTTT